MPTAMLSTSRAASSPICVARTSKRGRLYAYRTDALARITAMPQGTLEVSESLEQLRWLQAGLRIKVGTTDQETSGIDTPDDLQRAEQFLATQQG